MEFVSSIAHNWRRERVKCALFVKDFVSYFSSPLKSFSGPGSGRPVFQLSSTLRCFNPLTRKRTLVFLTLLSYASALNECTKFTGHSQLSKSGSRTVLHRVSFFPYFAKLYIIVHEFVHEFVVA